MNFMENIAEVLNNINTIIPLKEVYLFGSYAYGKPDKDSDIDLYLIVDNLTERHFDIMLKIRKSIDSIITKPIDILLNTSLNFNLRSTHKSTLEYKILQEGKKIYG